MWDIGPNIRTVPTEGKLGYRTFGPNIETVPTEGKLGCGTFGPISRLSQRRINWDTGHWAQYRDCPNGG